MFIQTLIMINSSLTSSFSFGCFARISKRHIEGEKIIASISLSTCETNFSLQKHYFENPNSETVQKWVPKVVSKFHDDPMVNEFEIVVLLDRFGCLWEKKKFSVREISFTIDIILKIPTVSIWGNMLRTLCSNLTTIQLLMSLGSPFY